MTKECVGVTLGDDGAEVKATARTDVRMSLVVNQALVIQMEYSMVCAVEYLKAHGVSAPTIERVLLQPARRRPVV